ncbi:hypothetical protein MBLNU230_g5191t1 [Neophaeotheca triangularis]
MDQLPAELVLRVHDFLDPPTSFRLSLTSKQLAAHSHDALSRHSRLSTEYHTCSDTPEVIQKIWEDPDIAWHVRCLTLRSGGEVLERDESALPELQDASIQCPVAFSSITPGCSDIHQRLNSANLPFLPAHSTLGGHRDALHTLLLRYCSRVELLKITRAPWHDGDQTRFSADSWRQEDSDDSDVLREGVHMTSWLFDATKRISKLPLSVRPTGFQALRTDVLSVFLLPNLESVYLRGLAAEGFWDESDGFRSQIEKLAADSSPVRHVCLESWADRNCTVAPICNIILACQDLETFILSSCEIPSDFDRVTTELSSRGRLACFFVCGDVSRLRGYWGEMYNHPDNRSVSCQILPVELEELECYGLPWSPHDKVEGSEKWYEIFTSVLSGYDGLETLVIHSNDTRPSRREHDEVDEGLARFITEGRDNAVPKLESICLDKVVEHLLAMNIVEEASEAFPKLQRAAKERQITTHLELGSLDRFADGLVRDKFGVSLVFDTIAG